MQKQVKSLILALLLITSPAAAWAQTEENGDIQVPEEAPATAEIQANKAQDATTKQSILFTAQVNDLAANEDIDEVMWDFGDGTQTTGASVSHMYKQPGTYLVKLKVTTADNVYENTAEMRIFENSILLVTDSSTPEDQIELHRQQAAENGLLLEVLQARTGGPEALVEEELTNKLIDARNSINNTHLIIMWTSGGVGANVLTKFAQHIRQSEGISREELDLINKGIILTSETPFAVLKPAAQSAFDQLQPGFILLARPQAIDLLLATTTSDEAKEALLSSPLEYRLLGTFSARTVADIGITNFMSFSLNYLVNRGVPIDSIILILMLPVIATILAFARQVVGIKSFGLITPALTALSFLVMGLQYGLIVFAVIVLTGTLTRAILRRLRLLYLPRMALVLTSLSLSLLIVLALGAANDRSSVASFSIFPALILTILAEEFIAAQFKLGVRNALTLTAWTLVLATVCYFIVSSELFRTLILSYPEIVLVTIPVNIILGQWGGLRLTEYFRFRELLNHGRNIA